MASMQQVNDFAHKWLTLYKADSTTEGMVTEGFADDCFALEFEMDTGKGFIAAFSEDAFIHADALQAVIDDVMNAYLLGSAIYSKWRGITHWWNEDLLTEDNRKWFITALSRLAAISGDTTMIPHRIAELYSAMSDTVIAPTVNYGATADIVGFPGTISLGVEGLRALLERICDQLYDYGFRHFIILNGHGGNSKSITEVGHHLYAKGAILANLNWWLIAGELHPEWKGGHGGGEETAAVMGIDPALIHTEYLEEGEGIRNDVSNELPSASWMDVNFKGGSVTIPRPIRSITDNGWLTHGMSIDPPTKATQAWGVEMLNTMAEYMRDFTVAFDKVALPKIK